MSYRIGYSRDVHRLEKGLPLILGGIPIKSDFGLLGHSDADCVLHTVAEAIIGALGLGDLGTHFPDDDPKYKGVSSDYFVIAARDFLEKKQYKINNIDVTVILERPLLAPYIKEMQMNIAKLLKVSSSQVNIKATRNEGLGFIGRGEAIASECVALIQKKEEVIKKYL